MKFALRDFRVNRIILQNLVVVIQLSRACWTPSLRLDIQQAHSVHTVSLNGITLSEAWR
ncbi:hypothetical protein [Rubritalea tangerina]|uniref:hypothetical protein n=1 Tax=Rubritalea tangerina TaxID=430798 RepID=UPI0036190918